MKGDKVAEQTSSYCQYQHSISMVYEEYARTRGLSYTALYIMSMIDRIENCTQKDICERTLLPKQTVNSVVTSLFKHGYIELKESLTDRRNKHIYYTEEGKKYIKEFIPQISEAENKVMSMLDEEQREMLLQITKAYENNFRKLMLE